MTRWLAWSIVLAGCGDAVSSVDGSLPEVEEDGGNGDASDASTLDCGIPEGGDALLAWLEGGNYELWLGEPEPHASSGPHGRVRVLVNETLADSLGDGTTMHPHCAATVKELYGEADDRVHGWAVMLKLDDESDSGRNWYWYEYLDGTTHIDSPGAGSCTGCHADGDDYYLSEFRP